MPNISSFGSKPSAKYKNFTLDTTGTKYTAPANGYFTLRKIVGNNNGYAAFLNTSAGALTTEYTAYNSSQNRSGLFIPCKKGDKVECSYNLTGDTQYLRFVYAEGYQTSVCIKY